MGSTASAPPPPRRVSRTSSASPHAAEPQLRHPSLVGILAPLVRSARYLKGPDALAEWEWLVRELARMDRRAGGRPIIDAEFVEKWLATGGLIERHQERLRLERELRTVVVARRDDPETEPLFGRTSSGSICRQTAQDCPGDGLRCVTRGLKVDPLSDPFRGSFQGYFRALLTTVLYSGGHV